MGLTSAGAFALMVTQLGHHHIVSRWLFGSLAVITIWSLVSFSQVWSNALVAQSQYNTLIAREILDDVVPYRPRYDVAKKYIYFEGEMPWSPVISAYIRQHYPALDPLVKRYFHGGSDVYAYIMLMHVGLRGADPDVPPGPTPPIEGHAPIARGPEYSLYRIEDQHQLP